MTQSPPVPPFLRRARIAPQQLDLLQPRSILTGKDGKFWGVIDGTLCGEFPDRASAESWMKWFIDTSRYVIYTIADIDKLYQTFNKLNKRVEVDATEFGDLVWLDTHQFLTDPAQPETILWHAIDDFKESGRGRFDLWIGDKMLNVPHNTIVYVRKDNPDAILNKRNARRFRQ